MKHTSRVKGKQKYLYRAVDSTGQTLDFLLSAKRDASAAKCFFHKALKAFHNQEPRVINVDKNAAYPKATDTLQADDTLPKTMELRQNKYLNNIVEQDHRNVCATGQSRDGICHGKHGTTNAPGLRNDEHETHQDKLLGVEKGDVRAQAEYARSNFWSYWLMRSDRGRSLFSRSFCNITRRELPQYRSAGGFPALLSHKIIWHLN